MNIQPELVPSLALTLPFLVAFVGVWTILWGPLLAFLEGREHAIHGAQHEAADLAKAADERLARLEARLAEAEATARAARQARRATALAEEVKILAAARHEADGRVAAALSELRNDTSVASGALRAQAHDLARRIAGSALGRALVS